ncbi:MAG: arginase family protein [Candidatus Pacearchaeota archaeon]|jgi:arginase family enzyme
MAIIVKVPVENSLDALGCRKASQEIVANLDEIYTSESGRQSVKANLHFVDFGKDLAGKQEDRVSEVIYKKSLDLLSSGEKCVFVGGDHSISYSTVKSFLDVCSVEDRDPCLIVFDAHPDCKNFEHGGSDMSNNVSWLRKLIDEGFPSEKVIVVGLRNSSLEENSFIEENKILTYPMKNILEFQEICDIVMELANKNQIYVSIDIDVVDGIFVPGTARPETAGFTSRQLLYFIQRLNLLKNIRAFDICEINPDKDVNNMTVKLGSKLLGEIIS